MKAFAIAIVLGLVALGNFAHFERAFDILYIRSQPELSQHSKDKLNELTLFDSGLIGDAIAKYGKPANAMISACGVVGNGGSLPERFKAKDADLRSFCSSSEYAKDRDQIRRVQIWYEASSASRASWFAVSSFLIAVALFLSLFLVGSEKRS